MRAGVPSQASLFQGPYSLHSVGCSELCGTGTNPSARRPSESFQQNAYQLVTSVASVLANYAAPIGLCDRLSEYLLELMRQRHLLGTPRLGSHCVANVAEQGSRFTDCYRGV